MRPNRGLPRLARTLVFAVAAIALSAAAHAAGGGGWPKPAAYAVVGPPVVLLALWLSAGRRRLPGLFGVLATTQVVLHAVYHLGHAAPTGSLRMHAARGVPSVVAGQQAQHHPAHLAGHEDAPAAATGLLPSPGMLLAHLLAVILTAWVMARGERALWRIVHRLKLRLTAPVPAPAPVAMPAPICPDLRAWVSRWAGRVVATRGPPLPA